VSKPTAEQQLAYKAILELFEVHATTLRLLFNPDDLRLQQAAAVIAGKLGVDSRIEERLRSSQFYDLLGKQLESPETRVGAVAALCDWLHSMGRVDKPEVCDALAKGCGQQLIKLTLTLEDCTPEKRLLLVDCVELLLKAAFSMVSFAERFGNVIELTRSLVL
jgi:hypothetical protein